MGLPSPTTSPEVVETWKGIKRDRGVSQKRAKPLLLSDLRKVIDATRPTFIGRRDAALLLVGWAAALRRSELVALDFDDIDFVAEGMVISIRKSKTDQEGAGYRIGIPFARKVSHCPTNSLKNWIDLAGITAGPLFFSVGTPGRKFHTEVAERRRIGARLVNEIIKRRLERAGLTSRGYSGHSLRAGFVTSAAKNETPEYMIQIHTRHI
jgi:integrase